MLRNFGGETHGRFRYLPAGADPLELADLEARLSHYIWRAGAVSMKAGMLSKKQVLAYSCCNPDGQSLLQL